MDGRQVRVRLEPPAEEPPRTPARITRVGLLAVAVLAAVTLFAAKSCQQAQVRVSKERAVATAREQARFTDGRAQVRLVRQGLTGRPYWAVSLSVGAPTGDDFIKLTTVRVDANTGKVAAVNRER